MRRALLATGLAALLPGHLPAAESRFEVMLWVDHQDWATPSGGREWDTNTPQGLEEIVEHCQQAGATTLCWRGFGGGLTTYASRIEEGCYPQLFDKRRTSDPLFHNGGVRYGDQHPDILGSVVEICHRRGLRCLLYWPLEDTHNLMAFVSRYALEHPGFWDQRQDGYASPARLSLAYVEVLEYKLALANEMIARGVDGFFLDFRRQSNWGPDYGYVRPALAAYAATHGRAPAAAAADWLSLRAGYNTLLLNELRTAAAAAGRALEIIAAPPTISPEPQEQLQASFVDWPTWVEQGLIDGLAPDTLPTWDQARPLESIVERMGAVRGLLAGRAKLYWPIRTGYDWGSGLKTLAQQLNQPVQQTLAAVMRLAWENGAAGVHDDTFDPGMESAEWIATLRGTAHGELRLLHPTPVAVPPTEARARSPYVRPTVLAAVRAPVPPALEDTVPVQRLTQGTANDSEARFSPDGRWVVFQSDRGGQGMRLWLLPAGGGQPRQLTFTPSAAHAVCNDVFPAFSADGQSIVFSSDRGDGRFYHLYTLPVAGGEPTALTSGNASDTLPCCRPDGTRIVFSSTREADLYNRSDTLWEVPSGGGEPRSLGALKYAQTQPSLSADGKGLAFTAMDELERTNWYACVSPGDPSVRCRLTSPLESCYGTALHPAGAAVAYTSPGPDRERGWDVWVRAVYSDALVRVTNSAANDRSPAWSPDGQRLVFESDRDGPYALYTVDVSSLAFPRPAGAEPWGQSAAGKGGMVDGDNDPEHTPLSWDAGVRPALDYMNRSFGRHLGRQTRVETITIVNDMPGQAGAVSAECRLDAAHTELYYGDRNGEFTRYTGPLTLSTRRQGSWILITLGDLVLETTLIKVRFVYPDQAFTAVCSTVEGVLIVNEGQGGTGPSPVCLWTTLQGQNRLPAWVPVAGAWQADGHELSVAAMPESDRRRGDVAYVVLPQRLEGDFDVACQFLLPDDSSAAGGPVLTFGAQADGTLYAVRYVNHGGSTTLQKRAPGQPWVQMGTSAGHDVSVGQWHELAILGRAGDLTVRLDGTTVAAGTDPACTGGVFGLGCQGRQVKYRNLRLTATSATALPDWWPAAAMRP